MLVAAAALWLAQGAAWTRSSVERELWIREAATDPAAHAPELAAALEDDDWVARASALDALRRARWGDVAAGERHVERVLELARRTGASERAAALAALAGSAAAHALDDAALDSAAREAPAVVLALVDLLEGLPRERGVPRLAALLEHPDPRVRETARAALAARGDAAVELARDLARRDPLLEREAWLDGLERLERQDSALPLADALDLLAGALKARTELEPAARAEGRTGVEALRALRGLEFDARVLAAGLARRGAGAVRQHALVLRAARQLAPEGLALARALLAAARTGLEAGDDVDAALDAAIAAAPRLEWLAEVEAQLAPEVWARLAVHGEALPPDAERWLDPAQPAELRGLVLEAAAALGEGAWLVRALDDPDPELAGDAFRALAALLRPEHAPDAWGVALHRAWRARPMPEALAALRYLPRERALAPFREDLLVLGEEQVSVRASCAELLGVAGAPREVREALVGWLQRAQEDLERAGGAQPEARAVALACLAGLARAPDAQARQVMALAADATEELDPVVAKRALALLAGSEEGARTLLDWLGPERPTRLRTEAAIGLAARGHGPAAAVLAETYALCDVVLRARALRAVDALDAPDARGLARGVLDAPGESAELVRLAVEWFARHGPGELLVEELAGARDPERVDALVSALGERAARGDAAARAALLEGYARAPEVHTGDELEAARRESLLAALARAGVGAEELAADWLARPLAAAEADLRARFVGRRLAGPTFAYRGELAFASALAARGELGEALARRGDLARLDARFAAHLGLAALAGEPEAALELFARARIGLAGEDPGEDGPEVELDLRRAWLDACEARSRYDLAARELERLAADWRGLRLDPRAAAQWLGDDAPGARLASALWQARAWSARASGDLERARALAREAAARVGRSAPARDAQERLEQALR